MLCIIMCQYKCRIRRKEVQSGLGLVQEKGGVGLGRDSQDVHFVEEGDTSRLYNHFRKNSVLWEFPLLTDPIKFFCCLVMLVPLLPT